MSFRLFIYYSAVLGGWAALFGWALGRLIAPTGTERPIAVDGIKGFFLGLWIALGLSLVDALWNLSLRRFGEVFLRVGAAVVVGSIGGLIGGMLGSALYGATHLWVFFVLGWAVAGLLIGASLGTCEVMASLVQQRDTTGARRKLVNGLIGGTAGGLLGGVLAYLLREAWAALLSGEEQETLWAPTALGFVALGMCIGLLVALAHVVLKEAWVRVDAGFRAGRELILTKEKTTIGRDEKCDIGLFGDTMVEKVHARIVQAGGRYFVEDADTSSGTFVNDQPTNGRVALRSGDLIRVGRNVLCFRERPKRHRQNGN
jgi:FHA domain-containing protein